MSINSQQGDINITAGKNPAASLSVNYIWDPFHRGNKNILSQWRCYIIFFKNKTNIYDLTDLHDTALHDAYIYFLVP